VPNALPIHTSCLHLLLLLCLQSEGNYKLAHSKLYSTLQQLRGLGAPVPLEVRRALALLHSYVLVKSLVGLGDHLGAARMLVRVAGSISR
jgi:WD repeat-containing protein 19